jgi:hypothetical protein
MLKRGITHVSLALVLTYVLCLSASAYGPGSSPPRARLVLWAWDRPENMAFIDTTKAGVAYLAATIRIGQERVSVRPRYQPLHIPPGTELTAVVRIEAVNIPAQYSGSLLTDVAAPAIAVAGTDGITSLQIDFDARTSERRFYQDLMEKLRAELPPSVKLTMTALASWCVYDSWISDFPVDEAVPMLFRMGADSRRMHAYLERGGDFRTPLCRRTLGISTDEPLPEYPEDRRIFIFNPKQWSAEDYRNIARRLGL